MRRMVRKRSVIRKLRSSERSTRAKPGPVKVFRPSAPSVPSTGLGKSDALKMPLRNCCVLNPERAIESDGAVDVGQRAVADVDGGTAVAGDHVQRRTRLQDSISGKLPIPEHAADPAAAWRGQVPRSRKRRMVPAGSRAPRRSAVESYNSVRSRAHFAAQFGAAECIAGLESKTLACWRSATLPAL